MTGLVPYRQVERPELTRSLCRVREQEQGPQQNQPHYFLILAPQTLEQ